MGIDTAAQHPENTPVTSSTFAGRVTERHPRAAGAVGAGLWTVAISLLWLYGHKDIRISQMTFMVIECWSTGLGCVGHPMLPLHLLGAEPSPRACERAAIGAYTAAALVSVLLATGTLRVDAMTSTFLLILPLSFAIQSGNAAQVLAQRQADRAAGAAEGEERGFLACALAIGRAHKGRDTKLNDLIEEADSTAELRYNLDAFAEAIEKRHATVARVTPLRAVNGSNGSAHRDRG